MTNFRWFLVAVCVLTAAGLAREPVFRPSKATVLMWLNGRDIIVVPVADYRPPVVEHVDAARVRDLKHVSGSTYRRFWFPHYGTATYSFRYPHDGKPNTYSLRISYDWTVRPGWIVRKPQSVAIVGPIDPSRIEEIILSKVKR